MTLVTSAVIRAREVLTRCSKGIGDLGAGTDEGPQSATTSHTPLPAQMTGSQNSGRSTQCRCRLSVCVCMCV